MKKDRPTYNELCDWEALEEKGLLGAGQRAILRRERNNYLGKLKRRLAEFCERICVTYPHGYKLFSPSRIKRDPEGVLTELRERTRTVADKRAVPDKRAVAWQYSGVRIINKDGKPKLWSPELYDIPEEKFKDVTVPLFDFSQSPGEIISLLEDAPYLVWNRVDTERGRLERQEVSKEESREMLDEEYHDVFEEKLFEHAIEAESLFSGQEKALDRLEVRRLLEENKSKFTDRQREVLRYRYFKKWTYAAIAKELGIDDKTVREHEKAALKKLKPLYI